MTLVDRVGELEQKVENHHQELYVGLESLQVDFKLMHAGMTEMLEMLLGKWDYQEKERKEKGMAIENHKRCLPILGQHNHGPAVANSLGEVLVVNSGGSLAYGDWRCLYLKGSTLMAGCSGWKDTSVAIDS